MVDIFLVTVGLKWAKVQPLSALKFPLRAGRENSHGGVSCGRYLWARPEVILITHFPLTIAAREARKCYPWLAATSQH